jgi:Adenylate and Guanylate cyclase catalytic domain
MNMAARMESTGVKHRIHISSDTAELLQAAGKENWIEKRKEMIEVKGKGFQNTFWVKLRAESASHGSASVTDGEEGTAGIAEQSIPNAFGRSSHTKDSTEDMKLARLVDWNVAVLAQRLRAIQQQYGGPDVIDPSVMAQLKSHVEGIAHMYRRNAFHNFEVCEQRMQ